MDQDLPMDLPPPMPPAPLSPPPPPPPQLTSAGRPKRNYRLPARYLDVNPEPLPQLGDPEPSPPLEEENEPSTTILPLLHCIVRRPLRTLANTFGLL